MLVLSIDPGALNWGWALQRTTSDGYELIDSGTDGLPRPDDESYGDYKVALMRYWWDTFPEFISYGRSEVIPGEDFLIISETLPPIGPRNMGAVVQMNLARIAVVTCQVVAMLEEISWVEMAANSIKKRVAGHGGKKGTKVQVTNGVLQAYPHLMDRERDLKDNAKDESDAIAVGLAHMGFKRVMK